MSSKDTRDGKDMEWPVDVRMLDRMLKRGQMTRKEHDRILKQAPDVKAKLAHMGDAPSND